MIFFVSFKPYGKIRSYYFGRRDSGHLSFLLEFPALRRKNRSFRKGKGCGSPYQRQKHRSCSQTFLSKSRKKESFCKVCSNFISLMEKVRVIKESSLERDRHH